MKSNIILSKVGLNKITKMYQLFRTLILKCKKDIEDLTRFSQCLNAKTDLANF